MTTKLTLKKNLQAIQKNCLKNGWVAFFCLSVALTEGGTLHAQNNQPIDEEDAPIEVQALPDEGDIKQKNKIYKNDKYPNETIEVRPYDANALQKAKNGLDYRKPNEIIEEERRQAERRAKEQQQGTKELQPETPPTDWGALGKVLTWIFIAIAVGLIVWLVMRAIKEGNIFNPANRKIKLDGEVIDLEHIEANLEQIDDLDPVIQQAIRQGNYPLAIRLYYLAILKALTESKAIVWKRDKTNRAYVQEMRNHTFFEPFSTTTRVFERIWYGNATLQTPDFERIKPDFDQLLRGVKNLNVDKLTH